MDGVEEALDEVEEDKDDFRDTFPLVLDHVGLGEDLELVLCYGVHWVGHVRGGGGLGRGGGGLG